MKLKGGLHKFKFAKKPTTVSISGYKDFKFVIKQLQKKQSLKSKSKYQQRRIKELSQLSKSRSKLGKAEFEKKLKRFLGIRKNGSINANKAKQFGIKKGVHDFTFNTIIRKKVPIIVDIGDVYEWNVDYIMENWPEIAQVLSEWNVLNYFQEFQQPEYSDWFTRLTDFLGLSGISYSSFINPLKMVLLKKNRSQ